MKSLSKHIVITLCLLSAVCFGRAPKVIKMIPENGATVKPGPCKMRFLFDQDMRQHGMSICGGGENYPDFISDPKWTGGRSMVINAVLKPGHEYRFSLNCENSGKHFKSVRGEPAETLYVTFYTAGGENNTTNTQKTARLDPQTQSRLESSEKYFSELFRFPAAYKNVSETEKANMENQWIRQLQSGTSDSAISAAANLGMVRCQSAAEPLEKVLNNPRTGGRFLWVCTRSLGEIGLERSIPTLINLIDNRQRDAQMYARVSLWKITGVYFGKDKEKWQAWYKNPSSESLHNHKTATEMFKEAILNHYSYRDMKGLNWEALFTQYQQKLDSAGSPEEFVRAANLIVGKAKDKHLWFDANGRRIASYINPSVPNMNLETVKKVVPGFKKQNSMVYSGRFTNGIGYIQITNWSKSQMNSLDGFFVALNELSDTKGLIIDVRGNSGGSETLALQVAGCFIDKPKLYAKHISIDPANPGQFSPIRERYVQPNKARPQYRGKVVVLTGPAVMSSCEAFVLMMKQVPGCVLIGETTQGSSGNPQPYDLGNGVTVYLPSWQAMLPDGTCFEGKGIKPDILVKTQPNQLTKTDPVIEAALKELTRR